MFLRVARRRKYEESWQSTEQSFQRWLISRRELENETLFNYQLYTQLVIVTLGKQGSVRFLVPDKLQNLFILRVVKR